MIFFLSDFHLGAPNAAASLEREKRVCRFLDSIKQDAAEIFIVGDLFDFGVCCTEFMTLNSMAKNVDFGIDISKKI